MIAPTRSNGCTNSSAEVSAISAPATRTPREGCPYRGWTEFHTPSVSQRPVGRFQLALRLAISIRHALVSGDSPQKTKTPYPLRGPTTHVLLVLRQLPSSDSLSPGTAPKQKRRTHTQARPHVFNSSCDNCHPATVCHRALPGENDPWRFRQQSSRVISIPFWYLTSWLPRFLLDQTPSFTQWLSCKTCII